MSKKAFIIWGLIIIQIPVIFTAISQYSLFSKAMDIKTLSLTLSLVIWLLPILAFGIILYLRSKAILRRKRIWALTIPLFLAISMIGSSLAYYYSDTIVMESGAQQRFFDAIHDWAKNHESMTGMSWTLKQKLDYILILLPISYLNNLGLFALLGFGCLNSATPPQNKNIQGVKLA